jgi:hypothetical protein
MATFCDAPNCSNLSFRTDKLTRKHYCSFHWKQYSTDIDKRSISQKALAKGRNNSKIQYNPVTEESFDGTEMKDYLLDEPLLFSEPKKYSLPKTFKPSREMYNEAYDIKKEIKPFVGEGELGKWFMDRRKEMTGVCMHCAGKTMAVDKEADSKFHYSVSHILPKSLFPSVSTHPLNFIELCYYGNSCHKNFDDHQIPINELNCFGIVIERLAKMYPSIAKEELRKIPSILMEYIKTEI